MKRLSTALFACALGSVAFAQDMTVSKVGGSPSSDFAYYGESSGIRAYSFGTTSCNVDGIPVPWGSSSNNTHPVIAQNIYRVMDGRIEQLGYSFLKHGFCAVSEFSCGACQPTPCSTLGPFCADTYGSGLNDGRNGKAKRDIQPTNGTYNVSQLTSPTGTDNTIRGRLQVQASDMGLAGARYFAESQYVSPPDQAAGFANNNCGTREINTSQGSGSINGSGHATIAGMQGIEAWQVVHPDVVLSEVVNLNEGGTNVNGYIYVGSRSIDLGGGLWRYEYAVHNFNSHQGVSSFSIPVPCAGVNITNPSFGDISYHSGDPYSEVDWTFSNGGGSATWTATETFAQNQNANAIRWGELYNFGFTADMNPHQAQATLGMFRPGTSPSLPATIEGPCGTPVCGSFNYCTTSPNSQGPGATITHTGSVNISSNNLLLIGIGAVPQAFGLFYYGTQEANMAFGEGVQCVGGSIQRINPPIGANFFGDFQQPIDFNQAPYNAGPGQILPGDTKFFQLWYRDAQGGPAGFNFSDGLNITFCP